MSRHDAREAEIVATIPTDAQPLGIATVPGEERHIAPIANQCHPGTYTYLSGGVRRFVIFDGLDRVGGLDAFEYQAPDGSLPDFRGGQHARWCRCNHCGQMTACVEVPIGWIFTQKQWRCVACCPADVLPR